MCETMQSSHRLRPAMALVRFLLEPTVSDDDTGARFVRTDDVRRWRWGALLCATAAFASLFRSMSDKTGRISKNSSIFTLFGGDLQVQGTRKSRWSRVGTSKIIS
jgi:hypothetical protein